MPKDSEIPQLSKLALENQLKLALVKNLSVEQIRQAIKLLQIMELWRKS